MLLKGKTLFITGASRGIGLAIALRAARDGANIAVAAKTDTPHPKLAGTIHTAAEEIQGAGGKALPLVVDVRDEEAVKAALAKTAETFGGIDVVVNTAAAFPSSPSGTIDDAAWGATLDLNVTANHRLADEAARILRDQDLDACIVLTSSANAVVPKRGSEAYDVSKAAVSHLVRELAISLAPRIRVNGVSPASVIAGSAMFPRDRMIASLMKYGIAFDAGASDDQLAALLGGFYAQRTLTHCTVRPDDCAQAVLFLAGPQARCTTGHLVPVDGGLTEAFLR